VRSTAIAASPAARTGCYRAGAAFAGNRGTQPPSARAPPAHDPQHQHRLASIRPAVATPRIRSYFSRCTISRAHHHRPHTPPPAQTSAAPRGTRWHSMPSSGAASARSRGPHPAPRRSVHQHHRLREDHPAAAVAHRKPRRTQQRPAADAAVAGNAVVIRSSKAERSAVLVRPAATYRCAAIVHPVPSFATERRDPAGAYSHSDLR